MIQCRFACNLWDRILKWIQKHPFSPQNWSQFIEWSVQHEKGKTEAAHLFKIIMAECTYGIWMERNMRIFQTKSRTIEQLAKEIIYTTIVRARPSQKMPCINLSFE